jgi:carboxylate-amine ligase
MPQIKDNEMTSRTLSLFEAYGIELEYMIVDEVSLNILPITDKLFFSFANDYVSDIVDGDISLNNELASHVVEFKTTEPAAELKGLGDTFHHHIQKVNHALKPFHARLMPTAMHPWMDPLKEMVLWPHGCSEIYDTLHRIFDCRGHGWANLQCMHINLPFANEEEFVRLHAAIRLVLPLIPSIAASSPIADGRITGFKDTRLKTYQNNQKKIFSVTAYVIPEAIRSLKDYQDVILNRIYKDMETYDPQGVLRHEWINSRGAIARFDRNAIEIRLLDLQETPVMDLAIASAITQLIKMLAEEKWCPMESYHSFSPDRLKNILDEQIKHGENARIDDSDYLKLFGFQNSCTAKELWNHIIHHLKIPLEYQRPLQIILKEGTLASRIQRVVGDNPSKSTLKETYEHLCSSLSTGNPFIA